MAEEYGPWTKIAGQPGLSTTWGFSLALLDLPALVNVEVAAYYVTAGCILKLWQVSNEVTGASCPRQLAGSGPGRLQRLAGDPGPGSAVAAGP